MEKQQLKRLSIAISAIMLLSVFTFLTQPINEANALQLTSVSTGNQNPYITQPIVYNSWNAFAVVSGSQNLLVVNASNNALITNMSLSASIGGSNKYISGIDCQNTAQTYHTSTIGTGGTEYCVVDATGGTGLDRVFLVDVTHGTASPWGYFYSNGYMFGRCIITGIPQTGGTVNCMYSDVNGANHVFLDYLSIPYNTIVVGGNTVPTTPNLSKNFTQTTHFDTGYTSGVAQPNDMEITTLISGNTGIVTNEMSWTLHGGTQMALFNLGSIAQICATSGMGVEGFMTHFAFDPSGVGKWYVMVDNAIKVVTDGTCTITNTLTLSSYDSSAAHIRGIYVGTIRKEIYFYDDIGNLVSLNQTSPFSKVGVFKISGDSVPTLPIKRIISTVDNPTITGAGQTDIGISVVSGTKFFIQYWGSAGAGGGSGGSNNSVTTCIDVGVAGGTLQKTCITCPGALGTSQAISAQCPNGYPNFGAGKSGLPPQFNGGVNGTQFLNAYGCTTGWFSCSNQDVTSNGIGFWFLIILIIASTMLLLWATYKTGHEVKDVTFAIILVAILESGALWQMKIVTPLPFYVGILGLIGMTGIKIYGKISNGGGSE